MSKSNLAGATCYLSGPIDFAADDGRSWRQEFINQSKHLNISIIDPTNKPIAGAGEVGTEKAYQKELRADHNLSGLRDFAKKIRRIDLRFCDLCDFLIAYIDTDIYSCGTWDEIIVCERQKKPIFGVFPKGVFNAPLWCFAMFRPGEMFESIEELIGHLEWLNKGQGPLDDRWVLFERK